MAPRFADPEARIMKDKGDFEYAYNAQISVDGESQVIVEPHVSQQTVVMDECRSRPSSRTASWSYSSLLGPEGRCE